MNQMKKIVVITAGGFNPFIIINALAQHYANLEVIEEDPESKWAILRRRAKTFGWLTAFGQLATMIISRLGKTMMHRREAEIVRHYGVSGKANPSVRTRRVPSVNDPQCLAAIDDIRPDIILTVSCRILKAETLAALACPAINFHAGINPAYRGLTGGYWALISNDRENFGSTVHLLDPGIDTGGILYQQRMEPSASDTISTYPLLQTAGSVDIVLKAVEDALNGRLKPIVPQGPSRLWFNPPVWTYLWNGITRHIW
jgi:folate-dependent phosphoribosylglycinamide formyltransferase PurN